MPNEGVVLRNNHRLVNISERKRRAGDLLVEGAAPAGTIFNRQKKLGYRGRGQRPDGMRGQRVCRSDVVAREPDQAKRAGHGVEGENPSDCLMYGCCTLHANSAPCSMFVSWIHPDPQPSV